MAELAGGDFLYRKWGPAPPAGAPRAVFLLVHGLGAHTARWEFLAASLARSGYVAYGLELRGFGQTPERPRGHVDSFRAWDRDILGLRDLIGLDHPGLKVFLLGESMGGLVAFNLALSHPERFAGLVLLSPAFKNGMKFPWTTYVKLILFLFLRPKLLVDLPFDSEMVTRDPAYLAVMKASPDELRQASLKLLASFLPEQSRARHRAGRLAVPVLLLASGHDLLVDERAERQLFGRLALADKTFIEYRDMLHALSIDLGRERVFQDIINWAGPRT